MALEWAAAVAFLAAVVPANLSPVAYLWVARRRRHGADWWHVMSYMVVLAIALDLTLIGALWQPDWLQYAAPVAWGLLAAVLWWRFVLVWVARKHRAGNHPRRRKGDR